MEYLLDSAEQDPSFSPKISTVKCQKIHSYSNKKIENQSMGSETIVTQFQIGECKLHSPMTQTAIGEKDSWTKIGAREKHSRFGQSPMISTPREQIQLDFWLIY